MTKYIKSFVTGHGITFERSKRNLDAFERATALWREIGSNLHIDGKSIIMLCGAKNNGKSSLMRHLINNYNCHHEKTDDNIDQSHADDGRQDDSFEMMDDENNDERKPSDPSRFVYLIDCDPGQCEMTSPGIVSAHIIRATAPKLESPTYLNVSQHESVVMSSVGGTNMSVNPKMYIENCRYVYNQVKEHQAEQQFKAPIFVNTMGHIRNVGLAMLMDLIKIYRPTNLLVLNVESDPMRMIYADLSPSAIDNTRASFYYETNQQSSHKKLDYKCDTYNLQFAFVDSTAIATKNRTALQLAYLASIPEALYKPVMQLGAKWLSLDRVSIYCVSSYPLKEGIVLELLHHSWIHLVKLRSKSIPLLRQYSSQATGIDNTSSLIENFNTNAGQEGTICKIIDDVSENQLFGCGIVAEIDLEKKRLAIITPVDQVTLNERVDCIIKPLSIQVPRQVIQEDY